MATPIPELLARLDDLANGFPRHVKIFGRVQGRNQAFPLYAFCYGDLTQPVVVISAGVHGDEPEGVHAAAEWLLNQAQHPSSFSLIVLPCLNPTGIALYSRGNIDGQDINRQFNTDVVPETAAVRQFLSPLQIAALIDLHTDPRALGFYFFELLRDGISGFAENLQQGLRGHGYPLEETPNYAGYLGSEGKIVPSPARIAAYERRAPGESLAEWSWQRGTPHNYVFETPRPAGIAAATQMHVAALGHLLPLLGVKAG